jgi:hypothetical protein
MEKDYMRVDSRMAKENAISDQNVKSIENIELCEQVYKRQKL